jgi:hypothetical protein
MYFNNATSFFCKTFVFPLFCECVIPYK